MRRALAAAVVLVAACKSSPASRPSVVEADAGVAAAPDAAVAVAEDASVPDAGSGAVALLEAARAARAQAERELLQGPEALPRAANDARLCAEHAKRAREADRAQVRSGGSPEAAADAVSRADAGAASDAAVDADAAVGGDAGADAAADGGGAVEGLYLQAVCTAAWLRTQGFTPLVERRVDLVAALSRVAAADPDLDGAGAERELGALFAELPANAGGDLDKARSHLDAAIARAPGEPRNHLVYARAVAVKAQDRALFERELGKVADAASPDVQTQARALLDREDDLFGPAQAAQPTPGGPH